MLHYTKKIGGFTVVELIVVIAIIGILATIGTISYNSTLIVSRNADRLNELKAWENAFTLHAQTKREYPSVPAHDTYCLGTGFPTATDITPHVPSGHTFSPASPEGYCGNLLTSSGRYPVDNNLNTQLLSITEKSPGTRAFKQAQFKSWKTAIGPYARFQGGDTITISHIFEGDSCPSSTSITHTYADGKRVTCSIVLPTNYSYKITP